MDEALKALYYSADDTGSFGGVERLYRSAVESHVPNITRDAVRDFLSRQRAYTLHKPARRHFTRNRTYVGKIDNQWKADLADMVGLTRDNGGLRYILTVIDIFSKFAWSVPVKNKDRKSVRDAFKTVLALADPRKPERFQTDKGKEFFNREFADLMRENDIQHFASESDQKAAVVERFNRTLKTRIWTYLSAKRTKKWADVLPPLYHRTTAAITGALGWHRIKLRQRTRTLSGLGSMVTVIRISNENTSTMEPPCESVVSKACSTRDTCPTGRASSSPCHLRCRMEPSEVAIHELWSL